MEGPSNPTLSAQVNDTTISLDNLNEDVLHIICSSIASIKEKAIDDNRTNELPGLTGQYPSDVHGYHLSALKSFSMTNKYFRGLSAPRLFEHMKITGTWSKASAALEVLENCPAAMQHVRTFRFDVFESDQQRAKPPKNLDHRLLSVLSRMPKISTLYLALPEFHADTFATVFSNGDLCMPTVRTLILASFNDFMVAHCPNVETISTNGWQFLHSKRGAQENQHGLHATRMIEAAGKARNLTYFEMNQWWEPAQIQAVFDNLPNLTRLGMPGGSYRSSPPAYLPTLAKFLNLEELILTDASNLRVGFHPPGCGNVYMGPGGAEYRKQVQKQGEAAADRVARTVFQVCLGLKKLWVGDRQWAEVVRAKDGSGGLVDVVWHYEGRVAPSGWVV